MFVGGIGGAWYEAFDAATVFQDYAQTQPVTASGQRVVTLRDKSGNNNHLVQDEALDDRPEWRTNHLYLDGLTWHMYTETTPAIAQPCSLTAAVAVTTPNNIAANIFDSRHATARHILGTFTSTNWRSFAGTSLASVTNVRTTANTVVSTNLQGASSTVGIDGTISNTGNAGTGASNSGIVLGANNTRTTSFLQGKFFGGVILARVLTADERTKLAAYFAGKMV